MSRPVEAQGDRNSSVIVSRVQPAALRTTEFMNDWGITQGDSVPSWVLKIPDRDSTGMRNVFGKNIGQLVALKPHM